MMQSNSLNLYHQNYDNKLFNNVSNAISRALQSCHNSASVGSELNSLLINAALEMSARHCGDTSYQGATQTFFNRLSALVDSEGRGSQDIRQYAVEFLREFNKNAMCEIETGIGHTDRMYNSDITGMVVTALLEGITIYLSSGRSVVMGNRKILRVTDELGETHDLTRSGNYGDAVELQSLALMCATMDRQEIFRIKNALRAKELERENP